MNYTLKSLLLVGSVLLGGCVNTIGKPINMDLVNSLTLGYSTQYDAKTKIGNPQSIKYDDGRTIYEYRYDNNYNQKQSVDLVFNKQQRLIDVTYSEME
ncbi:hypothetical protein [Photobacterium leiognathi]|uniref:hypothetical protein n=1 Tax=Photobacterium leiognathi TaxID=553611 RepID=UPI002981A2D2|nr:hypothetical protein [Photobacterium leiognathi]